MEYNDVWPRGAHAFLCQVGSIGGGDGNSFFALDSPIVPINPSDYQHEQKQVDCSH